MLSLWCVRHIRQIFPAIYIQHNQCPCRYQRRALFKNYEKQIHMHAYSSGDISGHGKWTAYKNTRAKNKSLQANTPDKTIPGTRYECCAASVIQHTPFPSIIVHFSSICIFHVLLVGQYTRAPAAAACVFAVRVQFAVLCYLAYFFYPVSSSSLFT